MIVQFIQIKYIVTKEEQQFLLAMRLHGQERLLFLIHQIMAMLST